MFRDAWLVAAKDLRIESRSRVATMQVLPFAITVLVMFAFALDGDSSTLQRLTPGLFWVAVMFSAVLVIGRSFGLEVADGTREALRLSGLDPAGIFLGKAGAVAVQLLALELVLLVGVAVLYGTSLRGWLLLAATCGAATVGIAAAGSLYGVLAAGLRVRESILPILLLPVLVPVLIAATRAFGSALGDVAVNGWSWFGVLSVFGLVYVVFGLVAFGTLMEET